MQWIEGSFQLNNVTDGFGDERRFKSFFDSGVIGLIELSEPTCNPDDKREGTFKQEDDGGQLSQDVSP